MQDSKSFDFGKSCYTKINFLNIITFDMANFQKYTRGSIHNLFAHFDRTLSNNSNKEIDSSRTHFNYNLAPHSMNQNDFLDKRLSEIKVLKRDNVNVLTTWIITLPKDFTGNQKDFFKASYDFLAKKYGEKNVVSAWVHLDETQPHLHFAFIPVVVDKKKGIEKCSAKECVTKVDLQKFHPELQNYLTSELGQEVHILNGATVNGNATIKELKAETALQQVEQERTRAKKELSEARERLTARSVELDSKEVQVKRKQAYLDGQKAYFDDVVANRETYAYALKGEFALHDKSPEKLTTQELKESVKRVMDSMAVAITTLENNIKALKQKIFQYRKMTPQQLRNTADAMDAARISTLGAYEDAQQENLQKQRKKSQNKQRNDWGR